MGFLEGHIAEEKVFNGKVFPKTLLPPMSLVPGEPDLAEMVKAEREWIAKTLQEHGAILFRGFDIRCAEDYSCVIKAFGWEEFCYQGPADRIKLADRVYTANAVPSDIMISFHHEMAMIKEFPPRIMFFCQQPPPVGGQTTIISSSVVVEKVEEELPQVLEKMEQDGIIFTLHTKSIYKNSTTSDPLAGTVWQRMLKTTDEVEAKKRALDMLACNNVKFNSDGTACFTFGLMNPIREFNGKRVMFNRVVGYETGERDAFVTFGDGSPVPSNATETIKKIYEENCVDINWQKGDILLVDNLAVQHARRPGKPPRIVLVSLSN
ncbi:clavaminate synthase-like protein [Iris pallida]|uniref:Clavaminate synthase-like protein n=1 Tax=Iris pallida TaxID=29817 RepID=A0AAX6I854_IRIPA|nr:clavaminate synthase-like protein [Iris pallida]KAJ6848846.1 clavaminate synthase-like protein [Iris pallida]KAJ6849103.1 clavaminate synthase-like protein [Iris pallida]